MFYQRLCEEIIEKINSYDKFMVQLECVNTTTATCDHVHSPGKFIVSILPYKIFNLINLTESVKN
jgi:hypothetical protein